MGYYCTRHQWAFVKNIYPYQDESYEVYKCRYCGVREARLMRCFYCDSPKHLSDYCPDNPRRDRTSMT